MAPTRKQFAPFRARPRDSGPVGHPLDVLCLAGLSPAAERHLAEDPVTAQKYHKEMPLGRFGRLDEDIAPIAVFRASDEGHYVTGQTINAYGGQVML